MSKNKKGGYGNPPEHGQFKKGESGNPKGRPRGSKNNKTIIGEICGRKMILTINGKKKTMSIREGLWETLVMKGFKGSTRDQIMLMEYLEKHLPNNAGGPIRISSIRLLGPDDPREDGE